MLKGLASAPGRGVSVKFARHQVTPPQSCRRLLPNVQWRGWLLPSYCSAHREAGGVQGKSLFVTKISRAFQLSKRNSRLQAVPQISSAKLIAAAAGLCISLVGNTGIAQETQQPTRPRPEHHAKTRLVRNSRAAIAHNVYSATIRCFDTALATHSRPIAAQRSTGFLRR
jgi:hypothetical protein